MRPAGARSGGPARQAAAVCSIALLWLLRAARAQTGSVLLVTGNKLVAADGSSPNATVYNGTHEVLITNQLISSFQNGITYWWQQASNASGFSLFNEAQATKSRVLLRFDDAHKFVPAGAIVTAAELSVSVINWNGPMALQACFLTQPWNYKLLGAEDRFSSTGFLFSRWDPLLGSVPWPGGLGAWGGCSPNVNISITVPADGRTSYWTQTIPLDPNMVAAWLANNGSANYGLMFRSMNATGSLVTSMFANSTLRRPALTITYTTAAGAKPPASKYPAAAGAVARKWYVGTAGSDDANSGHASLPFRSLAKALVEAWPGDSIMLLTGTYPGSVFLGRSRVTIQSAPGNWAVVASPLGDPRDSVNVFTAYAGVNNITIQNLEIAGGFYYGIGFLSSWGDYGTPAARAAQATAPSGWVLSNLRIHDTGSSAIKLVMASTNITIANCEIYNTGARMRTHGYGIEAVQAYDVTIRDSYFHDLPGAAVLLSGGTARVLLERNFVARTDVGFSVGSWTDPSLMEQISNPDLHEAINVTLRSNILTAVRQAGVALLAARGAVVAHNTLHRVQERGQAAVLLASIPHYPPGGGGGLVYAPCSGVAVWGNVLVRSETALPGPVFQIRADGLNASSPLVMAHNAFFDQAGGAVLLEDQRAGRKFLGNVSAWAAFCGPNGTLAQPLCGANSAEGDAALNASTFSPLSCSPARALVRAAPPPGLPAAAAALAAAASANATDFHGRARPNGTRDAGAVQSTQSTPLKAIPPVPAAFASRAAYKGPPPAPAVPSRDWPFYYWLPRVCRDLVVDTAAGDDNQGFDYYSNYTKPFATIARALERHNQCDRILLRGGQTHTGGFVITRNTNLTITTHPADLPAARATVLCAGAPGAAPAEGPCVGTYGPSPTAITLASFDVVVRDGGAGPCVQFNGGAGSGTSTFWSFYVNASGRGGPLTSFLQDMSLTGCRTHGVKLSTYVRNITLERLNISGVGGSGIEVVGGGGVAIRGCRVEGAGGSGIRLGGGVRGVVAEQNLVRNVSGVGIFLGSEDSDASLVDLDWALAPARGANPVWSDAVDLLVRNNIVDGAGGAGLALYSARDAVVVHNSLLNAARAVHAGILLNVSPKQVGPTAEVGPPNKNVTVRNNLVTLAPTAPLRMVLQARILQGTIVNRNLTYVAPNGTCAARRRMRSTDALFNAVGSSASSGAVGRALSGSAAAAAASGVSVASRRRSSHRRALLTTPLGFTDAFVNDPRVQGRNPDGSCPIFPDSHSWHADVSTWPLHPRSEAIKSNIGPGNLHADFGGWVSIGGKQVPAGIPFSVVDSRKMASLVPYGFLPDGYPDESVLDPAGAPLPPDAPVQRAFPGCGDPPCDGDRHLIVLDNATCILYEGWRSFPPSTTNTSGWLFGSFTTFNLSRSALGRPLGATSADAAGLPILPGLVTYDEVVNKGVINHALRFTGPNSRAAYALPATHSAASGYMGQDSPWMGMRVRLSASFDCTALQRVARVFCVALKKYGAFFADNGLPWDFAGEGTASWDAVLGEMGDIRKIPSSAMEVLDPGCLCLDAPCTMGECNGGAWIDPNAPTVYAAIANATTDLSFGGNIYFAPAASAAFVDQRVPPLGEGFRGNLTGWAKYVGSEAGSKEADPALDPTTYKPKTGSPARASVPRLSSAPYDFYNRSRGSGTKTDAGAALA